MSDARTPPTPGNMSITSAVENAAGGPMIPEYTPPRLEVVRDASGNVTHVNGAQPEGGKDMNKVREEHLRRLGEQDAQRAFEGGRPAFQREHFPDVDINAQQHAAQLEANAPQPQQYQQPQQPAFDPNQLVNGIVEGVSRANQQLIGQLQPQREPEPEPEDLPDPMIDPGGYTDRVFGRIERKLEDIDRREQQRQQDAQAQQAQEFWGGVQQRVSQALDTPALQGRDDIKEALVARTMNRVWGQSGGDPSRINALIDQEAGAARQAAERELGRGAQAAAQIAANAGVARSPHGGASMPATMDQRPPDYNHADPSDRESRAMAYLDNLSAQMGVR